MFYWFLKRIVLGPILRLLFRPYVIGIENVPESGGAIFASNHLSFSDSIFLPLVVDRRITFLAKADYFTGSGHQGPADRRLLQGRRAAAGRPVRRQRLRGGPADRAEDPPPRRLPRDLPRGHPLAGRPALPRQDRRRPDGTRGRGAGAAGGDDRHREDPAARPQAPHARHPGRHQDRQAARLLPLRGHGGRPVRPALDHRRDHVRADGPLRPGVRRHLRPGRQGPDQGREGRAEVGPAGRGHARPTPAVTPPPPDRWPSRPRSGARWRCSAPSAWSMPSPCYARRYDEYLHPLGGWVVLGGDDRVDRCGRACCTAGRPAAAGRCSAWTWPSRRWRWCCPCCSTTPRGSTPAPRPCRWSGRPRR